MLTRINILSPQQPWTRGFNDFYPLLKWRREFRKNGIEFRFIKNHFQKKLIDSDIVIIDYRYLQRLELNNWSISQERGIEIINKLRQGGVKVVLFDTADGGGSRCLGLTQYVDVHLKKQLFKDRSMYLSDDISKNYMPWIPQNIFAGKDATYRGCGKKDIHKLRLGWNIGMNDYRQFPFSEQLPFGTNNILNSTYVKPKMLDPKSLLKDTLLIYRGGLSSVNVYRYQRKIILDTLKGLTDKWDIIIGKKVRKSKYLNELRQSRIVISPFGWGEICYRDFEAFINGAILLKPDLSYLETFPEFFVPNHTYAPIKLDLSNLSKLIDTIQNDMEQFISIANVGQKTFQTLTGDFNHFYNHFIKNILN